MVVVTALIRVAFLIDVGLLYSSVFLVGLVVVIVVMVGLVVVVVINYWWWLWQSSGCGRGDSLCKGCSCNSCRRALGVCKMFCKVYGVVVEVVVVGFMLVVVGVVSVRRTTKTNTTQQPLFQQRSSYQYHH